MLAYILNRDVQKRWNALQPTGGDVCQSFHGLLMWRNRSVVMVKDVPQKHEPLLWPRCSLASPSQALFTGCGTMNGLGEPSTGHAPSFLSTLTNPGWFYVYVRFHRIYVHANYPFSFHFHAHLVRPFVFACLC